MPLTKAEAALAWPDDPPLLIADDIIYRGISRDGSQRDLSEWVDSVFNPANSLPEIAAQDVANRVLCEVLSDWLDCETWCTFEFLAYFEVVRPPREWLAACWNEMLNRLIYVVPKAQRTNPGWQLPPEETD